MSVCVCVCVCVCVSECEGMCVWVYVWGMCERVCEGVCVCVWFIYVDVCCQYIICGSYVDNMHLTFVFGPHKYTKWFSLKIVMG